MSGAGPEALTMRVCTDTGTSGFHQAAPGATPSVDTTISARWRLSKAANLIITEGEQH
jgi:hypothetical protein